MSESEAEEIGEKLFAKPIGKKALKVTPDDHSPKKIVVSADKVESISNRLYNKKTANIRNYVPTGHEDETEMGFIERHHLGRKEEDKVFDRMGSSASHSFIDNPLQRRSSASSSQLDGLDSYLPTPVYHTSRTNKLACPRPNQSIHSGSHDNQDELPSPKLRVTAPSAARSSSVPGKSSKNRSRSSRTSSPHRQSGGLSSSGSPEQRSQAANERSSANDTGDKPGNNALPKSGRKSSILGRTDAPSPSTSSPVRDDEGPNSKVLRGRKQSLASKIAQELGEEMPERLDEKIEGSDTKTKTGSGTDGKPAVNSKENNPEHNKNAFLLGPNQAELVRKKYLIKSEANPEFLAKFEQLARAATQ